MKKNQTIKRFLALFLTFVMLGSSISIYGDTPVDANSYTDAEENTTGTGDGSLNPQALRAGEDFEPLPDIVVKDGITVTLNTIPKTDAAGDEYFDSVQELEFTLAYTIADEKRPTSVDETVTYELPDILTGCSLTSGNVICSGTTAGTYSYDEATNLLEFSFNQDFLNNNKGMSGAFTFSASLDPEKLPPAGEPVVFDFPGASTKPGPITVKRPGAVEGLQKSITSNNGSVRVENEDGTPVYYADYVLDFSVTGETPITEVTIVDTLGSNLEFVPGTFTMDGAAVAEGDVQLSAKTSRVSQTATLSWDTLSTGTHELTYAAKVVENVKNDHANNNSAKATWKDVTTTPKSLDSNTVTVKTTAPADKTGAGTTSDPTTGNEKQYGDVKWTVVINDPEKEKIDVSGFYVRDMLGASPSAQTLSGILTVEREGDDGSRNIIEQKPIANYIIPGRADRQFEYYLPKDAGMDTFYLTYYSTATNGIAPSGSDFRNTVSINGDSKGIVTTNVQPDPVSASIEKRFVSQKVTEYPFESRASWEIAIDSSGLGDTAIEDFTFTDTITAPAKIDFDSVKVLQDGTPLIEYTDYESYPADNYDGFSVLFYYVTSMDHITITYDTVMKDESFEGTILNTGNLSSEGYNIDDTKTDSYSETRLAPSKSFGGTEYQAEREGGAGYVSSWSVNVGPEDLSHEPYNFGNTPLIITDTWDNAHMQYDSVAVTAYTWDETQGAAVASVLDPGEYTADPTEAGVTFTITNPGQRSFVIDYKTVVLDSVIQGVGTAKETFENHVVITQTEEGQDTKVIGRTGATGDVDYNHKVLTKEGLGADPSRDEVNVLYTVKVNQTKQDLDPNSDTLKLHDKITSADESLAGDVEGTRNADILADTIKITDGETHAVLGDGEYIVNYDAATGLLEMTIPDSRYLIVEYKAFPRGEREPYGTETKTSTIKNEMSLVGAAEYKVEDSTETLLKTASATVTGDQGSLTIHKVDGEGNNLGGAEFILYMYRLNADGVLEYYDFKQGTATAANTGTYTFTGLNPNGVYIVEETTVPDNYTILNPRYLVILKGNEDLDAYNKVLAQAVKQFPDLVKVNPNIVVQGGGIYNVTNVRGVTLNPEVKKVVENEPASKDYFRFKIEAITPDAPMPEIRIASRSGSGTAEFGPMYFSREGVYDYKVTELPGRVDNYIYDDAVYIMHVAITQGADETFTSQITYTRNDAPADDLVFTNTYAEPTAATFAPKVRKAVNGTPDRAETFNFEIQAESADAPLPENVTASSKGAGIATFDAITFSQAGTYTYKIVENAGTNTDYTYDKTEYTMTVQVTEAQHQYRTQVSYAIGNTPVDEMKFTNTYTRPDETTVIPQVTKVVSGNPGKAETFRFAIAALTEGAPMPAHTQTSVVGAGTATFDAIPYQSTGSYDYQITEVAGDALNYTYDPAVYNMHVDVTEEDGKYIARDTYSKDGGEVTEMTFTNRYTTPNSVSITPTVRKALNGTPSTAATFNFQIKAVTEGAPMPVKSTASRRGAGVARFRSITYKNAGTYVYTVNEIEGIGVNYTYDKTEYTMTVQVTEGAGQLEATVSYATAENAADEMKFTNTYANVSEVVVIPEVTKIVEGTPDKDETFNFQIDPLTLRAPMPSYNQTGVVGAGTAKFDGIAFNTAGTYEYRVTEIADDAVNYSYDSTVYIMQVVVTENAGTYSAKVTYSDGTNPVDRMEFRNVYTRPQAGEYEPVVEKIVNGDPDKTENFHFTLTPVEGTDYAGKPVAAAQVPMPEQATVSVDGAGTASFGKIAYNTTGTYDYEITENNDGIVNYDYDTAVYQMHVVVTEAAGEAQYKTEVSLTKNKIETDKIVFTNTYNRPGEVSVAPEVEKVVEGSPAEDETFNFEISAVSGVNVDGDVIAVEDVPISEVKTASVAGAGKVTFPEISYQKPGIYEYDIKENAGENTAYTYDTRTIHMVVTVTEAAEQYDVTVAYTDNGTSVEEPTFTNVYKTTVTPTPTPSVTPTATPTPTKAPGSTVTPTPTPTGTTTNAGGTRTGDPTDLIFLFVLLLGSMGAFGGFGVLTWRQRKSR